MIGPISCVPTPQFAAAGSSSRSPAIAGRVTLEHSAEALSSRNIIACHLGLESTFQLMYSLLCECLASYLYQFSRNFP